MDDAYMAGFAKDDGYEDGYEVVTGPNGFECCVGEPEDRTFKRDLRKLLDELNRQDARIAKLEAAVEDDAEARLELGIAYDRIAKLDDRVDELEGIIERLVPEGELEDDEFEQAERLDELEQAARDAAGGK